ncbi:helix-turn-helix transcriptional regulator [Aeromonas caviae]|uniref:helix-turn-helix domain-containing protein n=1 Tax=Aeromonas caviae TaxID=648 RepID=UPI0030D73083
MDRERTLPRDRGSIDHAMCQLFKRHLKRAGISYKALAGELNMSEASVKRLLNQTQPFTLDRMLAIATLLGVPLSQILTEAEQLAASVVHFTPQQDAAFCQRPELYSLLLQILQQGTDPDALCQHFGLNAPSLYLYLPSSSSSDSWRCRADSAFVCWCPGTWHLGTQPASPCASRIKSSKGCRHASST